MWNLFKSTVIVSGIALFMLLKWLILIPLGIIAFIWAGKRLLDEAKALEEEQEKRNGNS